MKLKYNANYNTILLQKENQILAVFRHGLETILV